MAYPELEALSGSRFGLVADAHIHPGQTPPLPDSLAAAFAGVDGILVLGDMGDPAGLSSLEGIAPVRGVLGADDAAGDARLPAAVRLFSIGGLTVGALFDAAKQGLFVANDPLEPTAGFSAAISRLFGCPIDVLLFGATHKPFAGACQGVLLANPGSPTLADTRSAAVLQVERGVAGIRHTML